ncbi:hypothetical protein BH23VER1_BH23VER1_02860 [soil metagenome]
MGESEKWMFRRMVEQMVGFTGVGCVTFCILGNHFHLLLEVRDEEQIRFAKEAEEGRDDAEVCRRVGMLSGKNGGKNVAAALAKELAGLRAAGKGAEAWALLRPLVRRMGDLSVFVKELKWRFSAWYNEKSGRVGTLWESRFRSVLVEPGEALKAVAAYIDLNPVRAGLATDPKDYRFCGYGEAVAKGGHARDGLARVVGDGEDEVPWKVILSRYRLLLYGRGGQRRDGSGAVVRHGVSEEAAREVEEAGGALSLQALLRCRVRYMTEGAALGSREFLERLLEGRPEFFGRRRKSGGTKMRGGDWGGLCAVRDLKG